MVLRRMLRRPLWWLRMFTNSSVGLLFTLTQAVAVLALSALLYYIYNFNVVGLAWTEKAPLFNFHILLMPLAFCFIYGAAILMYRVMPARYPRTFAKALHATLLGLAFVLAVVGLQAVFQAHGAQDIPALYSLHSWIGLFTTILFAAQLASGFYSFLFPGLSQALRRLLLPFHSTGGVIIYVLAVVSVLTGLMEHIVGKEEKRYKLREPRGVVANIAGSLVLIHAILVLLIALLPHFKSQPAAANPDESAMENLTYPDTKYSKLATAEN